MRRALSMLVLGVLACDPGASEPKVSAPSASAPTPSAPRPSNMLTQLLGDEPSVMEYREVDELRPAQRGKEVRVHGWVKPGTIAQRSSPPGLRFTLVRGDAGITVEHAGPLPERFQERLETIVTGTLSDDGTTLVSDALVAKCPDDYETLPEWPNGGAPR